VPEESFVVEEADLVSGSSIILMDVGKNPIKKISSCCFKKTWELIVNVLIEVVASCRELTTLWVARLNDGTKLKVTDPKEQQGDVDKEEAEGKERGNRVDC